MDKLNREMLRMELQISELIRVVANLNERLKQVEENEESRLSFQTVHYSREI